jgi:glutaredoxin-like protein
MAFLNERDREEVRRRLEDLAGPVRLVFFTQELECPTCRDTHQLLQEVAALSDKVKLETRNFAVDREEAERYGIHRIPATVFLKDDQDFGIRFYGIPAGYEFATFLETLRNVSQGKSRLSQENLAKVEALEKPLHLQVFVTPT